MLAWPSVAKRHFDKGKTKIKKIRIRKRASY